MISHFRKTFGHIWREALAYEVSCLVNLKSRHDLNRKSLVSRLEAMMSRLGRLGPRSSCGDKP